ncbi:MAG TPA: dipeptide epimerase [Chthoniobacteraceae bacterium]|nr:dipeptide epimerase [Chthoniobacteraceae bacterium]
MRLHIHTESWKLVRPRRLSRGARTETRVISAMLIPEEGEADASIRGRGEATPSIDYHETVEGALAQLREAAAMLEEGRSMASILDAMPSGSARNALDCAWWDWRAKVAGQRVSELVGWGALHPLTTAYTIGFDTPEAMEAEARAEAHRPLLKISTGSEEAIERVAAVRRGAPQSQLIVDGHEAWPRANVRKWLEAMAGLGVVLVEQPLPAGEDDLLARMPRPVPVFADESFHVTGDLDAGLDKYDGVSIKLDKTGGLTEALRALERAKSREKKVLCGCLLGTSLAIAPAMLLAQHADWVDLDAPMLLQHDQPVAIMYEGSVMQPYPGELWG